ncbi:MAG TPA: hypothetical protein VMW75_22230 [Thermoanaerobaculia bacterium]|nr:hypothetical protein [Thermoanaerobaculia bacterium]
MNQQRSTTHLAGWIRPGSPYLCGGDLYMRVDGSVAGKEAAITLCLADALRHGFPAPPAGGTSGPSGNWLELCGILEPSRIGDERFDPEHAGELTVDAVNISQRDHDSPAPHPASLGAGADPKAFTVFLAPGDRGLAARSSA